MAKKILSYWFLPVLALVLLLRLPSLFEPFTYGDEGIYLTLGQGLRKGLVFYRDIHDNKPPMLYLLAAVAGNFETYRLILFGWSLGTIYLFFKLAERLFPKKPLAVIASTTAFALLTSLHNFEGNVANAENFMMLPTIAAFYLALPDLEKIGLKKKTLQDLRAWLLAGVFLSIATLFKVPAAFDFLALLSLLFLSLTLKNFFLVIRNSLMALLGFLIPVGLSLAYYAWQGAWSEYLKAAFLQNIPYLSSWAAGRAQVGGLPLFLLSRGLLVFLLVLGLFFLRKKVSLSIKLTLVWFAFSWFAALLSARPYPHYLIQILPALSLAVGFFWLHPIKIKFWWEKAIPLVLAFVVLVTFSGFHFWYYKNLPYYRNFYGHLLGLKSRDDYYLAFDPRTETIYQAANYLKTHTLPQEKIFIWGNDPFLYALAQRLPIGRYTVAYHIIDFNGYQETMKALNQNPPRYLIISGTEDRLFPELKTLIFNHYLFETRIGDLQFFHRNAKIRRQ